MSKNRRKWHIERKFGTFVVVCFDVGDPVLKCSGVPATAQVDPKSACQI